VRPQKALGRWWPSPALAEEKDGRTDSLAPREARSASEERSRSLSERESEVRKGEG